MIYFLVKTLPTPSVIINYAGLISLRESDFDVKIYPHVHASQQEIDMKMSKRCILATEMNDCDGNCLSR